MTPDLASQGRLRGFFNHMDTCQHNCETWMTTGACGPWSPVMLGLYELSMFAIFLAYMVIPLMLVSLRGLNHPLLESSKLNLCFVLFILFCGTGHLIDLLGVHITEVFGVPWYYVRTAMHAITAVVSVLTVIQIERAMPRIAEMVPREQLEQINAKQGNNAMMNQLLSGVATQVAAMEQAGSSPAPNAPKPVPDSPTNDQLQCSKLAHLLYRIKLIQGVDPATAWSEYCTDFNQCFAT